MPILRSQLNRSVKVSAVILAFFILTFYFIDDVVMPRYTQQGRTTVVPSVLGKDEAEAAEILRRAGLEPKLTEPKLDKQYPVGSIALQNPPAGAEVKFGRGVYITVSGGELLVQVPALRGKSLRDATFSLERFSLKLAGIVYEPSDEFFENTVMGQSTEPGTKVRNGTAISLVVSQGRSRDKGPVPNVVMKALTEAEKILTQAGFKIGNVTYQMNQEYLPNTVIEQYPKAGELMNIGQAVDLFVTERAERRTTLEN